MKCTLIALLLACHGEPIQVSPAEAVRVWTTSTVAFQPTRLPGDGPIYAVMPSSPTAGPFGEFPRFVPYVPTRWSITTYQPRVFHGPIGYGGYAPVVPYVPLPAVTPAGRFTGTRRTSRR